MERWRRYYKWNRTKPADLLVSNSPGLPLLLAVFGPPTSPHLTCASSAPPRHFLQDFLWRRFDSRHFSIYVATYKPQDNLFAGFQVGQAVATSHLAKCSCSTSSWGLLFDS